MKKTVVLVFVLLLSVGLAPIMAQDGEDCDALYVQAGTLLQQAQEALDVSDASTAMAMLEEVAALIAPCAVEVVSANADWTPVIQEFEGVEMVQVPAGCFMMGSTDEQVDYAVSLGGQQYWYAGEQPAHQQCFDEPFWIDRYEVTNQQYAVGRRR